MSERASEARRTMRKVSLDQMLQDGTGIVEDRFKGLEAPNKFGCTILSVAHWVREAPFKETACSNRICPNSVSTPPQANGRFVAGIFRRKLANS